MAKRKGIVDNTADFLSKLPLEVCLSRLQLLPDDDIQVFVEQVDSDTVNFVMNLREKGVLRAEAVGQLRRWEGTLTRVDCHVSVHEGVVRWLILLTIVLALIMVLVPMAIFLAAKIKLMMWFGISSLFLATVLGFIVLTNHYTPADDTPRNLLSLLKSTLS